MIVITSIDKTCTACPSQWDGYDDDGNYYYFRLRHGRFSVEQNDEEIYRSNPDGFDGVMDFEELKHEVKDFMLFECQENQREF